MSLYSIVEYTSDGTSSPLTIPFGYLRKSHIFLFKNDELSSFEWIDATSILPAGGQEDGDVFRIKRLTDRQNRITGFADGQTLLASDLDATAVQLFYIQQEIIDGLIEGVIDGTVYVNNPLYPVTPGDGGGQPGENPTIQWIQDQVEAATRNSPVIQELIGGTDSLGTRIVQETQERIAALQEEAQARVAAIQAEAAERQAGLQAEADARFAEVQSLQNEAAQISSDLQAEASTRFAEVQSLQSQIDADTAALQTEVNARLADVGSLQSQIDAETAALQTQITNEQTLRQDGDTELASTLSLIGAANVTGTAFVFDLNTAQVSDGVSLSQRLSSLQTEISGNEARIISEEQTRSDADSALASALSLIGAENAQGTAFVLDVTTAQVSPGVSLSSRLSSLQSGLDGNSSAITSEQSARVSADDALASDISAITSRVDGAESSITSNDTAIANESLARAAATSGLQSQIDGNEAAILSEQQARVDADQALASDVSGLNTRVGQNEAGLVSVNQAVSDETSARTQALNAANSRVDDAEASIASEAQTRAQADSALASDVSGLNTRVGQNEAGLVAVNQAVTDETTARTQSLSAANSRVDDAEASIASEAVTRAQADSALSSEVSGLNARVGDNEAGLVSVNQAVADETSSRASQFGSLSASLGTLAGAFGSPDTRVSQDFSQGVGTWVPRDGSTFTVLAGKAVLDAQSGDFTHASVPLTPAVDPTAYVACVVDFRFLSSTPTWVRIWWVQGGVNYTMLAPAGDIESGVRQRAIFDLRGVSNWHENGDISRVGVQFLSGDAAVVELFSVSYLVGDSSSQQDVVSASITSEQQARVDADSALASDISGLNTRVGDNEAGLVSVSEAVSSETTARTQALNAANSRVDDAEASIVQEAQTRADADNALANDVSGLNARVGDNEAGLVSVNEAVADETSSRTQQLSVLSASVGQPLSRTFSADLGHSAFARTRWSTSPLLPSEWPTHQDDLEGEVFRVAPSGSFISILPLRPTKVEPGRRYKVRYRVRLTGATVPVPTDGLNIVFSTYGPDPDSPAFSTPSSGTAGAVSQLTAAGSSWTTLEWEFEARPDAVFVRPELLLRNTWDDPSARLSVRYIEIEDVGEVRAAEGNSEALVIQEAQARAQADLAIASDISGLNTRVGDNEAGLVAVNEAVSNETSARTTQISSLRATVGSSSTQGAAAALGNSAFSTMSGTPSTVTDATLGWTLIPEGGGQPARWARSAATGDYFIGLRDVVPWVVGKRYRIVARVRYVGPSFSGGTPIALSARALNSSYGYIRAEVFQDQHLPMDGSWDTVVVEFTATSTDPSFFRAGFQQRLNSGAQGDVEVSYLGVEEIGTAQEEAAAEITQVSSVAANALGRAEAMWTLRTDVNGRIIGFGLSNDGQTGSFAIMADEFLLVDPDNPTGPGSTPFAVINGQTYISEAFIGEATIGTLNLKEGSVGASAIGFENKHFVIPDNGFGRTAAQATQHFDPLSIETGELAVPDEAQVVRVQARTTMKASSEMFNHFNAQIFVQRVADYGSGPVVTTLAEDSPHFSVSVGLGHSSGNRRTAIKPESKDLSVSLYDVPVPPGGAVPVSLKYRFVFDQEMVNGGSFEGYNDISGQRKFWVERSEVIATALEDRIVATNIRLSASTPVTAADPTFVPVRPPGVNYQVLLD